MKQTALPVLYICLITAALVGAAEREGSLHFFGMKSTSAALALGGDMLVAAGAEDNLLRIYNITRPLHPPAKLDLSDFLGVERSRSVHIAGVTRIGERLYWISSHSRDKSGQVRAERYCLFACALHQDQDQIRIVPEGKPYTSLMQDLVRVHTMRGLRLESVTRLGQDLSEQARLHLAPKRAGLHIAALCASSDPEILYIGFRNPRPVRVVAATAHALVVPLDNAAEVIGKGEKPIFGEGMLWDLDGLGIISFEYSPFHGAYFILAGPHDDQELRALYRWSGMKMNAPERICTFDPDTQDPMPDTLVPFTDSAALLLLGVSRTTQSSAQSDLPSFWMSP
jgi:hypothetical protein